MRVHIDKAGGDDPARHVDLARARRPGDIADRGDAVAGDRDIGPPPRPAAAVDDLAAAQDPIGHRQIPLSQPRDTITGFPSPGQAALAPGTASGRARRQANNSAREAPAGSGAAFRSRGFGGGLQPV